MKSVLVGSAALRKHLNCREPKDIDLLVNGKIKLPGCETYDCNVNPGLREIFDRNDEVATLEDLYALKVSHSFWDVHWPKTMHDIAFMQENGVEFDKGLFNKLYAGWTKLHGNKPVKLNVLNEVFFTQNVDRVYVHDDIHRAISYYDTPMFERVKKDKSKAYISRKLFADLSHEDKIKLCREEIYVTALERFLIPRKFTGGIQVAYTNACRLLITSMSKGFFPLFMVLNWSELKKPDNHPFVSLFKKGLNYVD